MFVYIDVVQATQVWIRATEMETDGLCLPPLLEFESLCGSSDDAVSGEACTASEMPPLLDIPMVANKTTLAQRSSEAFGAWSPRANTEVFGEAA